MDEADMPIIEGDEAAFPGREWSVQVGRRRRLRGGGVYVYLLPSIAILTAIFAVPIVDSILLSLQENRGIAAVGHWAGVSNFTALLHSGLFWQVFVQTVVWTIAVVLLTTVLAYLVARVLQKPFRGRSILRSILMLPWATSIALSAVVWKFAFEPQGLVNRTLGLFRVTDGQTAWLADLPNAAFALIFVGVWVSIPFTAVMLGAAMRSIPPELYEAAAIDGARGIAKDLFVTVPLIRRILLIVTLANFVLVFNSFPIIYIMTNGGPVNKTDILATYLYRDAFSYLNFGMASAISVFVLVILLVLSYLYVHFLINKTRHA